MIKNYFTIAWRNMTRNKLYAGINVFGLAFGICACIVIYLITSYDLSFDKFHPDKERIYRVVGQSQNAAGETWFLNSLIPDVAGLQNQIPGFEQKAAFYDYSAGITIPDGNHPPKKFDDKIAGSYSTTSIITSPAYFDIFQYHWLAGNAKTLNTAFNVVLSANRARKYFGNIPFSSMLGKKVIYDDSLAVSVSGIVEDWKGQTDFGYTDFISIATATHSFLHSRIPTEDWSSLSPHSSMAFVKLASGTSAQDINNRFAVYIKQHVKQDNPGAKLSMWLQPLGDIHFTSSFHRGDDGDDFRKAYLPTLYVLMGVALFILLLAIVNFINLSTAQSIQRAREIGVRKVLGSNRLHIILQFLTETLVLTIFAVIVAVLLVDPFLYFFSDFIPRGIQFTLFNPTTLGFLGLVTLLTAFFAGLYPAKVLSSYLPAFSLKGMSVHTGNEKINLRKALIVFQFTVSLVFIMGAIVIGKQINFMKFTDKGFNTDAIITINKWRDKDHKIKMFAQNIRQVKGIDKILLQDHSPMGFAQMGNTFLYKGNAEKQINAMMEIGNDEYVPFYKMKLVAGRNMLHTDSLKELVINQAMSAAMGFDHPQDALGKYLWIAGPNEKAYPVVGVIADFHQGSFHDAILPAAIVNEPSYLHSVAIKLTAQEKNTAEVKAVIAGLEREWKKVFPESDFSYGILNESIAQLYGQEEKTAWLVNAAMVITIFISCIGLFGLGMFTAERRTKEIGIRKVLGAQITDIVIMLSKDFIALVLIAIVLDSPLAWYGMKQWLQDFTYRTSITAWIFAGAGGAAVLIALLTVSFQAIKAAIANPVKSLRSE